MPARNTTSNAALFSRERVRLFRPLRRITENCGPASVGIHAYTFAMVCIVAQATTILVTWPLWQVQAESVSLPVLEGLPAPSMGVWILASLALAAACPRWGSLLHALLLTLACLLDQARLQPQLMCVALLLVAAARVDLRWTARWFLAALWLWAGLHKFFSPDWHEQSWLLAERLGLSSQTVPGVLRLLIPTYEVALGVLALVRPRWAIWLCVPLHLGIAITFSPILLNYNFSVIPWNLATAITGSWLLWEACKCRPATIAQRSAALILLIAPTGFYLGWVDHTLAFVLYSDNLPRGLITTRDGVREIAADHPTDAVFPYERRLLLQYFQRTAQPGWKLHISDPRPWLDDEFWVQEPSGRPRLLSVEEFSAKQPGSFRGVALDNRRAAFRLAIAGARLLKRHEHSMIYAVEFSPESFRREMLQDLSGLLHVEQLQLRGCPVTDADIVQLPLMRELVAIGLSETLVTDHAVTALTKQPKLRFVEVEGTSISLDELTRAGLQPADR